MGSWLKSAAPGVVGLMTASLLWLLMLASHAEWHQDYHRAATANSHPVCAMCLFAHGLADADGSVAAAPVVNPFVLIQTVASITVAPLAPSFNFSSSRAPPGYLIRFA